MNPIRVLQILVVGGTLSVLSACGTTSGAVVGGVAGNAIGGNTASTVAGAVAGGIIGNQNDKR